MQTSLEHTVRSHPSVLAIGAISLAILIVFQALDTGSAASAKSRDEFPGRRQGGGTHWVTPLQPIVY